MSQFRMNIGIRFVNAQIKRPHPNQLGNKTVKKAALPFWIVVFLFEYAHLVF